MTRLIRPTLMTLSGFALSAALFAPGVAVAQDPFRHTGLEGGGYLKPFQMPRQNVPTHTNVTNFPPQSHNNGPMSGGHGQIPGGHGQMPGNQGGHGQMPGNQGGHGQMPGNQGGHGQMPGNQGGHGQMPGGVMGGQGGMPNNFPPGSNQGTTIFPINVQMTDINIQENQGLVGNPFPNGNPVNNQVTNVIVQDGQGAVNDPSLVGNPGNVPVVDNTVQPVQGAGLAPSDEAAAAGALGVVVVNQTTDVLGIAVKFQDPQTGQWITRWSNNVVPGQAIRFGFTTNGAIFLRADFLPNNPQGKAGPAVNGSDNSFMTPQGPMGLQRVGVGRLGNDLVTSIKDPNAPGN
jgi:hypothetical protein